MLVRSGEDKMKLYPLEILLILSMTSTALDAVIRLSLLAHGLGMISRFL